jgi:hypothetical protein
MKSFTVNRINPDTFLRGEDVLIWISPGRLEDGVIQSISHTKQEAKVNGVWYEFERFYKNKKGGSQ